MEFLAERAVAGEGLQQRAGIGEAAGFDDDALKARHHAARPVGEQRAQRLLQVAAHRAAQATITEQHGRVARRAQQRVVDADFAVFVDDERGVGALGGIEQRADQRRLAGAEKAGDDRDRQARAARPPLRRPERARTAGEPANSFQAGRDRRSSRRCRSKQSALKSRRRSARSARRRRRRCWARRAARSAAA